MGEQQDALQQRYHRALDSFVDKVRQDPNVTAVVLEGSLAYDKVWEKSDIDLVLICRSPGMQREYALDEDNIYLNVDIVTREEFRRWIGAARSGDFTHSLLAKAKMVYTTDDSLAEYMEEMKKIGEADLEYTLFHCANWLLSDLEKMEKWLAVRRDPRYAQLYLLRAAEPLAQMRLLLAGEMPNRESVPRAMELDPAFMEPFYARPLSGAMDEEEIRGAMAAMESFLLEHLDRIKAPLIRYLEEGEIKTFTMIANHFGKPPHALHSIMDFLTTQGAIERLTETIRITPKGRKLVEEAAFLHTGNLFG